MTEDSEDFFDKVNKRLKKFDKEVEERLKKEDKRLNKLYRAEIA